MVWVLTLLALGRARGTLPRARPKRVPKPRQYFYTKIRFSTPGSAPTCESDDTLCRSRRQPRTHAYTQQQQLLLLQHQQHACDACWFMNAGPCAEAARISGSMHACRFMHASSCRSMRACQLLLKRACVRRAYCKKCRVNLGSKSFIWLVKCTCLNTTFLAHAGAVEAAACGGRIILIPRAAKYRINCDDV